jgi:rod shape determining protein RodA
VVTNEDRPASSRRLKNHPSANYLDLLKPKTRGRWDWLTPLAIAGLGAIGVAFIYSAQLQTGGSDWEKQLVFLALGAGVYGVVALVDYRFWLDVAHWFYLGTLLLLVLVLIPKVGSSRFGAQRWLDLGFFSLQPADPAKVAVLLMSASLLVRSKMDTTGEALGALGKLALAAGVPILLILCQPDLKPVIVLPPMVFALLYISRFPTRLWAGALVAFLLVVGAVSADCIKYYRYMGDHHLAFTKENQGQYEPHALLPFMHDYQRNRLVAFFAPARTDAMGTGWNEMQSLISVGSGGLLGKGWTKGTQAQLGYLPRAVAHNDFIASVIAEESGFVGSFTVLSLFGVLLFNGLRIAGLARDRFGTLLALGVTVLFAVHMFVNIAMTIGLVPITGIPLPFVSSGGTFVLCCCLLQGLVQSVYRFRKDFP